MVGRQPPVAQPHVTDVTALGCVSTTSRHMDALYQLAIVMCFHCAN